MTSKGILAGFTCRWKICAVVLLCVTGAVTTRAQTLTTLVSFNGTDGSSPQYGSLLRGTDGNFYGTTDTGGANNSGTVFKVTPTGALTTLYSFCSQPFCTDGANPYGGLVQGTDGNFYGTTSQGGADACYGVGCGTVFKLSPAAGGTWTETVLHSFDYSDGFDPLVGLIQATDGNFYGITAAGGNYDYGTVFQMTPTGALTTLYNFCSQPNCPDGALPRGLMQGKDGNFYGTTSMGGTYKSSGTVFELSPAAGGAGPRRCSSASMAPMACTRKPGWCKAQGATSTGRPRRAVTAGARSSNCRPLPVGAGQRQCCIASAVLMA